MVNQMLYFALLSLSPMARCPGDYILGSLTSKILLPCPRLPKPYVSHASFLIRLARRGAPLANKSPTSVSRSIDQHPAALPLSHNKPLQTGFVTHGG